MDTKVTARTFAAGYLLQKSAISVIYTASIKRKIKVSFLSTFHIPEDIYQWSFLRYLPEVSSHCPDLLSASHGQTAQGVVRTFFIKSDRAVAELGSVFFPFARELFLQMNDALLIRNVFVMVADFCLGGRGGRLAPAACQILSVPPAV